MYMAADAVVNYAAVAVISVATVKVVNFSVVAVENIDRYTKIVTEKGKNTITPIYVVCRGI